MSGGLIGCRWKCMAVHLKCTVCKQYDPNEHADRKLEAETNPPVFVRRELAGQLLSYVVLTGYT